MPQSGRALSPKAPLSGRLGEAAPPERGRQNPAMDQEQRYEQTTNAPIAVQEGMNGLKLVVGQGDGD
jgi:hypothetical protein